MKSEGCRNFPASGLGFGAEEHDAIPDSAFSESLPRIPGFRYIIILEALHFPPEPDRAEIPLHATLRKAETVLKSSQTVEVRNGKLSSRKWFKWAKYRIALVSRAAMLAAEF